MEFFPEYRLKSVHVFQYITNEGVVIIYRWGGEIGGPSLFPLDDRALYIFTPALSHGLTMHTWLHKVSELKNSLPSICLL